MDPNSTKPTEPTTTTTIPLEPIPTELDDSAELEKAGEEIGRRQVTAYADALEREKADRDALHGFVGAFRTYFEYERASAGTNERKRLASNVLTTLEAFIARIPDYQS